MWLPVSRHLGLLDQSPTHNLGRFPQPRVLWLQVPDGGRGHEQINASLFCEALAARQAREDGVKTDERRSGDA